jgi:TetR/AcrR family tetracycline transcriptional repressor
MLARYRATRVPRRGESWDTYTLAKARSFRKALLAVRDGARVNAGTRPGQGEFAEFEHQLALYVDAGFSPDAALHVSISMARYVLGFVLEEQGERQRDDSDHDPMEEVAAYPLLAAGVKALMAGGSINTDSAFEAGLNYMVAGMRLSLSKTAPSRSTMPGRREKQKRRPEAPLKT